MKTSRTLALSLALVCSLSLASLSGCGGSKKTDDAAPTEAAQSEPAKQEEAGPTDEELITADFEKTVGTSLSKETILAGLREDEELASYEQQGMDLEAYAENMANIVGIKVDQVTVDGDTAVVKSTLTVPDFGEEAQALVTEAVTKELQNVDTENMTEDDLIALSLNAVSSVLADPSFPTATEEFDVDYVKSGDTWAMKDPETVNEALTELANSAANV